MPRIAPIILTAMLAVAAVPALAKDTTYRDPRNPSFSLLVPDGWTASKTDSGVSLSHGKSSVILMIATGSRPPSDMVADIVGQFRNQAKNFRQMDSGDCRFGGQQGAYTVFFGIGPNGTADITRVVSMTNGQLVYTLISEIGPNEYDEEQVDLQRIQDSFAPEAIATSVDDREKLDALFAAGVINQQEYEARKKNLGGNYSATPPPAAVPNNGSNAAAEAGSNPNGQKLAALDQAYRSGVLTKEEYETKKRQLEQPGSPSSSSPGSTHFRAPDGSYSTVLPPGWTSQRTGFGAQALDTFSPNNGGQERIMISATPATANLQQFVPGLATMTTSMFPALRLTHAPNYGKIDGNPAAELQYEGVFPNGARVSAWHGVRLMGGMYYSVFCVAQSDQAAAVERDADTMLRNLHAERTR